MLIKIPSVTMKVVSSTPAGFWNHSLFVSRVKNIFASFGIFSFWQKLSKFITADMLDNFKTGKNEPPFLFSLYEINCSYFLLIWPPVHHYQSCQFRSYFVAHKKQPETIESDALQCVEMWTLIIIRKPKLLFRWKKNGWKIYTLKTIE